MYLQLCSCVPFIIVSYLDRQYWGTSSPLHTYEPHHSYSIDKFIRRFSLGSPSRIQIWLPFPTKNGLVRGTNKTLPVCSLLGPFSVIRHYLSVDRSWPPVCSDLEKAYQSTLRSARALPLWSESRLSPCWKWLRWSLWRIESLEALQFDDY